MTTSTNLPAIDKVMIQTSDRTSPKQVDSLKWVLASDRQVPPNAIMVGQEMDGRPLYFGRCPHLGSLQPGKVGRHLNKGLSIVYDEAEIDVEKYYVLCGDASLVRLRLCQAKLIPAELNPIVGGSDKNGDILYLAKCTFLGADQIGKGTKHLGQGMKFGFDGREFGMDKFFVLCII